MVDKQDGHVPGGEQKEVDGLMNLGFFMDMYGVPRGVGGRRKIGGGKSGV